jgi:hypothetical protein
MGMFSNFSQRAADFFAESVLAGQMLAYSGLRNLQTLRNFNLSFVLDIIQVHYFPLPERQFFGDDFFDRRHEHPDKFISIRPIRPGMELPPQSPRAFRHILPLPTIQVDRSRIIALFSHLVPFLLRNGWLGYGENYWANMAN